MSNYFQKTLGIGLIIVGGIATGGLGFAALAGYGAVVTLAGGLIFGAATQRMAKSEAEAKSAAAKAAAQAAFLAGLKDRTATTISTEQHHRTLYGLNKVGGNIVAMFPSGDHDEFKTCVVVFANHEVNAYTKFYVAGKPIGALDANGWVTGGAFFDASASSASTAFTTTTELPANYVPGSVNVYYTNTDSTTSSSPVAYTISGATVNVAAGVKATVSYQYTAATGSSHLRVIQHLGADGEAADSYLTSTFPTKWTAQHKLEGHAYCVFVLDLRQSEFQGGPPSFQAEVQGKKLYDPRTSLTTYSDNNALVLRDYLTGPYLKIPSIALPSSDYIAAANDCDDVVRTGAVAPQSNKRYTFNGVISANESPKKVLEQIALSMCGTIDGNTWSVYAGKYRAPIMTLTQEDIVGGLSIAPGLGFQGTYNTVRGQYVSPSNDYVATDFAPFINTAYLAADGQEISTDAMEPYTNNITGIYSIERIRMQDSRNGLLLSGDFSYKTWALRPGDRITFTSTLLGMTNKIFRVTDKSVQFGSPVKLTLKEDASTIWDQTNVLVADSTPNTTLSDPFAVPALPGLTAASGTATLLRAASGEILSRILVSWQPANYQGTAIIDIEWRRHVSSTWESVSVNVSSGSTYLTSVIDKEGYVIRARLRSVNLGATGVWSYIDHTVVGKSEPPPDVTGFTATGRVLSWDPINLTTTPDLVGYTFAFHYGTSIDWGSASALNTGIITESPYQLPNALSGQVTLMIKAVDSTGNHSKNAMSTSVVLGAPSIANILQTVDYGNTSYPGTLTGGVLSGTTLLASATDSFFGLEDSSMYGASDLDSFYSSAATSYGSLQYTTAELNITSVLAGSNLTMALVVLNSPEVAIEYRAPDTTSFYGMDGNSFFGLDADSVYTDGAAIWLPWPGQISAKTGMYQFRVTLGENATARPSVQSLVVILDAPDIVESLSSVAISSLGTVIPYTKPFTQVLNVQATLNSNSSGGVTVETDKATLVIKVYNLAHTAVSGATVDLLLRGY